MSISKTQKCKGCSAPLLIREKSTKVDGVVATTHWYVICNDPKCPKFKEKQIIGRYR